MQQSVRRGLTLDYAMEKRAKLLSELRSDDHYARTDTIAYGHHDPFSVPLSVCDHCGGKGQMRNQVGKGIRWSVVCLGCDKQALAPQRRPWQAALEWNQINLGAQDYRALALFGLSCLEPDEARMRMAGIRRNLELRKNLAGIERTIAHKTNQRPPGREYQQRLEAYLKWAMLALRLIKVAKKP